MKYASGLSWTFQDALSKNATCVTQLFDPIRMDENTRDREDARANTYRSRNEKTHNNHLHVTARDAHLMP
ncbi:MAG: hypothetical protein Q7T87_10990 [Polaromonas sp.]|nr:hypothetical protein [Polaromonas sp.]